MKRILAIIFFTLIAFPAHSGDTDFLLGEWYNEENNSTENWFRASPDLMLGLGFSVGEEQTFFDFFRIESREGGLVYIPQPFGNPPTIFKQKPTPKGSLTFINADHDYPQLISYEKTAKGLKVTISLINGEQATSWTLRKKD